VALLTGCAGTHKAEFIAFDLAATAESKPAACFRLSDNGELRYAVGPQATATNLTAAGTLSDEQRAHLLDIVHQYKLNEAPGTSAFATDEQGTYHLTLRTSEGTHQFTALDDQVPGVKEFYNAVFQTYCDLRYDAGTAKR
jgi:hypothetical protein